MGMEIAQIALSAGADDIGSTMMEENVVSASGTTKTMATEDELRRAISEAGFVPSKRDSDYNSLEMTGKISNPIHSKFDSSTLPLFTGASCIAIGPLESCIRTG